VIYEYPELYDELYGSFTDDVDFYVQLVTEEAARHDRPNTVDCLELACGTGRVARALVRAGFPVVGVDSSQAMLDRAERSFLDDGLPTDRFALQTDDMRTFVRNGRFSVAIIALHSASHLLTTRDLQQCFSSVYVSLREGGCLALALHNPDPAVLSRDPDALALVPFPVSALNVYESTSYDRVDQTLVVRWYVERASETLRFEYTLRMVFPEELVQLLERCGFFVEARYGWYDRSPLTSECGTQIVVARKRSGTGEPSISAR
jgi:SAM-dependent methyltransferase